jgi:HSP90 family molecular chaperone
MIPLLTVFALSLSPIKNYVSLQTYISENAKLFCPVYYIYEDITDIIKKEQLQEKTREDFFEYLKQYDVECKNIGGYFFFRKKNSD